MRVSTSYNAWCGSLMVVLAGSEAASLMNVPSLNAKDQWRGVKSDLIEQKDQRTDGFLGGAGNRNERLAIGADDWRK